MRFALLLFVSFSFLQRVLSQGSGASCCSLSSKKLRSRRRKNPSCINSPTSRVLTLSSKCQKCPKGTCRLGYTCICPTEFQDDSSNHDNCVSSFGRSWPVSVGKADVDWRNCRQKIPDRIKASGRSCCAMTAKQLGDLRGWNNLCPRTTTILSLTSKCQKCPRGTCRVGYACYCPDEFLQDSSNHDDCESSFGVSWPVSSSKSDVDWRGCNRKKPSSVKSSGRSCCAMTSKELNDLRGWNDFCPRTSTILSLSDKCQKCPAGTCRLGTACYCPDEFLRDSSNHDDCESSFGAAWPISSRRSDVDWRGCFAKTPASVKPSSRSCCAMNSKELNDLRGWNKVCPSTSTVLNLSDKCQKCPAGTCRLGYSCYCPDEFLRDSSNHDDCESSFGASWPVSAGKVDLDFRYCGRTPPPTKASFESCCRMSVAQLTKLRGVSNQCPSSSIILSLSSKCQSCPPGTCRIGYSCYCPDYFISSTSPQQDCEDSFGVSWPVTVGKKDLDWRSCMTNAPKAKRSNKSCCKMSKSDLTALRGLSNSCPSTFTIMSLAGRCGSCPAGTCRINQSCKCPEAFLGSSGDQNDCEDAFGVAWPASTRKRDTVC